MRDSHKKVIWHIVRVLVAGGLVAYVLSQTTLHDAVRPEPGAEPMRVLRDTPEGVVVRTPEGGERLIRPSEFWSDERPEGPIRITGILGIIRRLGDHWGWALAAVAVMMFQTPISAVRWRLLLGVQGIHISFLESLRLTYIGWFFNNWMPGATGGDLVKAYYIARQTQQKTEAVTVVFLDRIIGLVAMCMLGGAAVTVSLGDERVRIAQVLVASFLAAAIAGGCVFYSRRLRRIIGAGPLLAKLPLYSIVSRVSNAAFVYRYHKAKVAQAMVYSWGTQAVAVLAMWWVATGLGSRAAWYHYFLTMPVIWIGWSAVPVPGGFGVAETLAQRLFTPAVLGGEAGMGAVGGATLALAMMLAYRVVQMLASLPGAFFYLVRRTEVSATHMREEMEAGPADA